MSKRLQNFIWTKVKTEDPKHRNREKQEIIRKVKHKPPDLLNEFLLWSKLLIVAAGPKSN